jgi:hypothetical protein
MRSIPEQDAAGGEQPSDRATRRKFGRLPQDTLKSNLGAVLDISAGGMRVLCHRVPRGQVEIYLLDNQLPGRLMAEVSWSKRVGLFKFEVGLRFENLTPSMSQCLTSIAAANRQRRVM